MRNPHETTVVAMASDEIYDWWLSFISSFRKTNPDVRLLVIPYNDNIAQISGLADVFGYEMVRDLDFAKADALSARLFGSLWHRHRLRKLLAFDLPVDDFLYIDVDTLVYLDAASFMEKFRASGADIAFCTPSNDSVFTPEGVGHPAVKDSRRFSTGIFAARRGRISFGTIADCIDANSALYFEIRHPTVVDQPILNLCASLSGWEVKRFDEIDRNIAPVKWYKDRSITFEDGLPRASGGRLVPVIHWAGNKDHAADDETIHLRRRFLLAAQARIGQKKPEVLRVTLPPRYSFVFKGENNVS